MKMPPSHLWDPLSLREILFGYTGPLSRRRAGACPNTRGATAVLYEKLGSWQELALAFIGRAARCIGFML